jgi:putative salt-induced outer membrane protein YdiY
MKSSLSIPVVVLLLATPLLADDVVLRNGNKVSGEVQKLEKGKLGFKTPHGELSIPQTELASLTMKNELLVKVGEGAAKKAAVATDPAGQWGWEGKKIKISDIVSILPLPAEPTPPSEGERWSGALGLSVIWTDGNTHNLAVNGSAAFTRDQTKAGESFKNKIHIDLKYSYGVSGGEQYKRQGFGGAKWDSFLHPHLGVYVEGTWAYDFEAGIERKNTLGAGLSSKLVDDGKLKITFDLGASYVGIFHNDHVLREAVAAGKSPHPFEEYPALRAMLEIHWKTPIGIEFHHKTVHYQSMRELGTYSFETETAFSRKLADHWFFKLSVLYTHEEPPAEGKRRGDITYILSVVFKF